MSNTILLKSWWFNVGDGFVKLGAEHLLGNLFGAHTIFPVSALGANKFSMLPRDSYKPNFPSLLDVFDGSAERIVLAGCVLNDRLGRVADKIEQMRHRPKIIFLGAGARNYDAATVTVVGDILKRLQPDLLVTRDSSALEHFGGFFRHARQGIDCAYWVSDAVPALPNRKDYQIRTFNRMADPGSGDEPVLRLNHNPFRLTVEPNGRVLRRAIYHLAKRKNAAIQPSDFISDDISEYLRLYSGAREVHTDMVHATVASAAYGTPVRMYYRTPRQEVITSVLGESVLESMTTVDTVELQSRKANEARILSEFLKR